MIPVASATLLRWMIACLLLTSCPLWSDSWKVLGPEGGDVRSLTYDPTDPDRIWMGTSTSTIFMSTDGGQSWSRFAHLGSGDQNVIDHIVVNPTNPDLIFASSWNVDDHNSGDIFRSKDGGKNWLALPETHGMPIRALAMSLSDPNVLAAGALDGVYRTKDAGDSWERISPDNHEEIKNIESIAIDPKNPDVIYAGTWHLAWKTEDGGKTWHHIKKGMIDDSDVFSIVVSPSNPSLVFASACSGIYVSDSGGETFHKVQGIPFSARRTRILKQDPTKLNVVYGGTTQGLWRTNDSGKTWKQLSSSDIVVNDILVDPRNSSHLLLATDRGGVLVSNDGGKTLSPSNRGYTHRYITTILPDKDDPETVFVGIARDREWGGMFSFRSGIWQQRSNGLGDRDVLALRQAANGILVAGTNRGVFMMDRNGAAWRPSNTVSGQVSLTAMTKGSHDFTPTTNGTSASMADAKVNDLDLNERGWLAATSEGLFISNDSGRTWNGGPVLGRKDLISVRASGILQIAATRTEVLISTNGGADWHVTTLPGNLTIRGLTITPPNNEIFLVTLEGAFRSSDSGNSWQRLLNGLPERDLSSISYVSSSERLLATSLATGVVFQSRDGGRTWSRGPECGFPLLQVKEVGGRLFGATPFDGLIAQP